MQSQLADALALHYPPLAVLFTDDRPSGALQLAPDRWACVISMFRAAARGRTVVFDRQTHGCTMGGVGLCLKDQITEPPGGLDCFLSTGAGPGFREGEGYLKSPALARRFIEELPKVSVPAKYVVVTPLPDLDVEATPPALICFFVDPDRLSALQILANYARPGTENVSFPMAAGCHTVCLLPYIESRRRQSRAVVGCADISCRSHLDPDVLSFTVPWAMFQELESNVEGSFLTRPAWQALRDRARHAAPPPLPTPGDLVGGGME